MYGKLFESTFTGSMYGKGSTVFAVWGYAISHSRKDGSVEINPRALASTLGDSFEAVQGALDYLQAPDTESRTKDEDGKRLIREAEYLYRIVNFQQYNGMRNEDERREYNRIKQREHRQRMSKSTSMTSADCQPPSASVSVALTVTEDSKNTTARKRALSDEEPEGFAEFRQSFPKRSGSQPWSRAIKVWRANVRAGEDPVAMIAGAKRYAAYIEAVGSANTNFVLQAATFLGPDKHYQNLYPAPTKPESDWEAMERLNGGKSHGSGRVFETEPDRAALAASVRSVRG